MKTLLTSLLLLATLSALAQGPKPDRRFSIYGGFDIANATRGGKTLGSGEQRNSAALDYRGGLVWRYHFYEFGFNAEIFPTIGYYGFGLNVGVPLELGYVFRRHTRLQLIPTVGGQLVVRDKDKLNLSENSTVTVEEYFNPEFALNVRFDRPFDLPGYIGFRNNLRFRGDVVDIWGRDALDSGFFPALWEGRSLYLELGVYLNFKEKKKRIKER